MTKKKGIFFLVDSLRYDVINDLEKFKNCLPNLYKIYKKSVLHHCVANSRSTQFVLPSLFTLSYPLDYGGYDTGIRNRPLSFVELLKSKNFETLMVSNSNQIGVTNGYHRGFNKIKTTVDFKTLLEHRIGRTIKPRIKKSNDIKFAIKELEIFFDELIYGIENYDKELWTKKLLNSNLELAKNFKKEKKLLTVSPEIVIKKIMLISQGNYYKFLGEEKINYFKYYLDKIFSGISWRTRRFINMMPNLFPFTWYGHISVRFNRFNKLFASIIEKLNSEKNSFFIYFHLMDLHDNRDITDVMFFLKKFRFLPRLILAKLKGLTNRSFNYDLSLMYIDFLLEPLMQLIENKKLEDVVILFTADHGSSIAYAPKRQKTDSERFLEMYREDLEVPVLVFNGKNNSNVKQFIDSMDTTAIFLSELGIDDLPTYFKGERKKTKDYIISEHAGRGSSDMLLNDLYFTITKHDEKLFVILKKDYLIPTAYFNLISDKNETKNLINDLNCQNKINELLEILIQERNEVLKKRSYKIKKI